MAKLTETGPRDIELGQYGSKWKHGWIPLNPSAAAIKAKRLKGGDHEHHVAEHHGGYHVVVAHNGKGGFGALIHRGEGTDGHYSVHATRAEAISAAQEHVATIRGRDSARALVAAHTRDRWTGGAAAGRARRRAAEAAVNSPTSKESFRRAAEQSRGVSKVEKKPSTRATRGSMGERITSHGSGLPAKTEAGKESRRRIEEELQRDHGAHRTVVGSIHSGASVDEVSQMVRGKYPVSGMSRLDIEHVGDKYPGWYVTVPAQSTEHPERKLFIPEVVAVDRALATANARAQHEHMAKQRYGGTSFEHGGQTYDLHVMGGGGHALVHTRGGAQVGEISPHPDGGFLLHSIGSKPGEPGHLPEHRVKTMKQAIAGLHAATTLRDAHRAEQQAKAASATASAKSYAEQRKAQEAELGKLVDDIARAKGLRNGGDYRWRQNIVRPLSGLPHEQRVEALTKIREEAREQAKRANERDLKSAGTGLFSVADMRRAANRKPRPVKSDTPAMASDREKLHAAMSRNPVNTRDIESPEEFKKLRAGSPVTYAKGGQHPHVGHVIGVYGNTVHSYHPADEHHDGMYYSHTLKKLRSGRYEVQVDFAGHSTATRRKASA